MSNYFTVETSIFNSLKSKLLTNAHFFLFRLIFITLNVIFEIILIKNTFKKISISLKFNHRDTYLFITSIKKNLRGGDFFCTNSPNLS